MDISVYISFLGKYKNSIKKYELFVFVHYFTLRYNCTEDIGSIACEIFYYLFRLSPKDRLSSDSSRTVPRRLSGPPIRLLRQNKIL